MNPSLVALASHLPPWGGGGLSVVLLSRVRAVRNLSGEPFPGSASEEQQLAMRARTYGALADWAAGNSFFFWLLEELTVPERNFFWERHIAGSDFAKGPFRTGVALFEESSLSFRLNDGEHLKFACLLPGLEVFRAYERVDAADSALSQRLNFAFDGKRGFLTADPSDMGTGLRVSLLLFLPALAALGKIEQVAHAVQLLGCTFGGLFGPGSSSESCIFQVHNRMTLGESEETILRRLVGIGEALVEQESAARDGLEKSFSDRVPDRMARVIALLHSARVMSLQESLVLLGQARLAACLGYLAGEFLEKIDELLTAVLPTHLQMRHGEWVSESAQEQLRAQLLRQTFAGAQLLR
ncbi:MAG: hypothetical protein LBB14_00195 [Puniceicoccales bacterium]|jgi:protein arginine kinase|nr:hypothetical protein [Puniceicoccales bacterium]